MLAPVIVLLAIVAPCAHAATAILLQLDCTSVDGTAPRKYDSNAVACENSPKISDATCELLFAPTTAGDPPFPSAGGDKERPDKCFRKGTTGAPEPDIVSAATELCPKTCGYCCKSSAYTCRNKEYPRVTCDLMANRCRDPQWRIILAEDCPATCGLCNEGGCTDKIAGCSNDPTICVTMGMEKFVTDNCQRTCGKCTTTTTPSAGNAGGGCTYIADSSTSCRAWAANGFCTNNFYTVAQRRSYCSTTCRIC